MASWQAHFVSLLLRTTFKPRLAKALEVHEARPLLESGASHKVPDDLEVQPGEVAGIPGEWVVRPGTTPQATLLHLHGGSGLRQCHDAPSDFPLRHGCVFRLHRAT